MSNMIQYRQVVIETFQYSNFQRNVKLSTFVYYVRVGSDANITNIITQNAGPKRWNEKRDRKQYNMW